MAVMSETMMRNPWLTARKVNETPSHNKHNYAARVVFSL
jgi:hypothetical protein